MKNLPRKDGKIAVDQMHMKPHPLITDPDCGNRAHTLRSTLTMKHWNVKCKAERSPRRKQQT